ncbi:glycine betaine ABC transporter substrate-binding protein [Corynebacterium macginleyi]|uniref:glycine betaine ABC transporter substrate-binding protein n=1 Tax=Corynebacterium macginleyi TaxID=38290 RepID=UPI00190BDFEE|nr:glycine betaine ABC transporter substrate-binding protein [Corynebacterium macginleyi]MBK4138895.1 glycine/betaine ABC transporter substrate-binding protein [Corynebacterium macginleyi]MBK4149339.1 glycine/betaine ABC transporter substrate-binding protein [Corynebacterium macginleyi]MBK4158425.1 glycine/betaine ABC transporter substrate-binding protein [Corynebacterium macginleyi]MBK4179327.1 glycine/betaine ABC transporter substrate-binding protein [Corynebacterium macginleyi]
MKRVLATLAAASTFFLAGCGLGTAGGLIPHGELTGDLADIDLDGAHISIGSKNFTEQIILGKIGAILLESAGANVADLTNIPGSTSARQALEVGDMDSMFEYTGTAWITYLGNTDPIPGSQEQYEAVEKADKDNGLTWLPPAPMNNTYALAMNEQSYAEYGLDSLADIKDIPANEQTFCTDSEFLARNDGLLPMLDSYGVEQPPRDRVRIMDSGAVYAALNKGECTFGSVFATDGRIKSLNLTVLDDTEFFFPKYNLAPVVRTEVLEEHPEIKDLFSPIARILTDDKMQELNARVDVDGEDYTAVARDFLIEEGLLEK